MARSDDLRRVVQSVRRLREHAELLRRQDRALLGGEPHAELLTAVRALQDCEHSLFAKLGLAIADEDAEHAA